MLGPVLVPAISAVVLLLLARSPIRVHRVIGAVATLIGIALSIGLLMTTLDGNPLARAGQAADARPARGSPGRAASLRKFFE